MIMLRKVALGLLMLILASGSVYAVKGQSDVIISVNPNPVYDDAVITISFSEKVVADIVIETRDGETITSFYSGEIGPGENIFYWNRTNIEGEYVPDGTYYIAVNYSARYTSTKKTIILK